MGWGTVVQNRHPPPMLDIKYAKQLNVSNVRTFCTTKTRTKQLYKCELRARNQKILYSTVLRTVQ